MAGLARDFVVVLPECGRNWFINDHAGKRYEDYLVGELIPRVRERYGAAGRRRSAAFPWAARRPSSSRCGIPMLFRAAFAVAGAFTAGNRQGDPYAAVRSDEMLIPTEAEHERVWGPIRQRGPRRLCAGGAGARRQGAGAPCPDSILRSGAATIRARFEASALMRDLLAGSRTCRTPSPSTRAIIPGPMRRRQWRG